MAYFYNDFNGTKICFPVKTEYELKGCYLCSNCGKGLKGSNLKDLEGEKCHHCGAEIKIPKGYLLLRHSSLRAVCEKLNEAECHAVEMDAAGNPPYNQYKLKLNSIVMGCSRCGKPWGNYSDFRFCPECGAKVVES